MRTKDKTYHTDTTPVSFHIETIIIIIININLPWYSSSPAPPWRASTCEAPLARLTCRAWTLSLLSGIFPFCKFVKILFFIILSVCLIPLLPFCHDAKILLFSIFTLMAFLILTFGASIISSRRPLPNVVRKIWNIPQWSKSLWINCIYLLNPQYWVNIAYNSRVWVLDWCQFSGFDILGCSHREEGYKNWSNWERLSRGRSLSIPNQTYIWGWWFKSWSNS